MKQRLIAYFILPLFFILISADENNTKHQVKDFEVFKKVLLSKEGTIDLHLSKNDLLAALNQLEKTFKVKQPLINQFKMYSLTLSLLECGHTQIHPNKNVLREWLSARNSLPIDFTLIGKHLIVNPILNEDISLINENKSEYETRKKVPSGAEILSIDNLTVDELVQGFGQYISSDENNMEFKYFQSAQLFDFFRFLDHPFEKDSVPVSYLFNNDTSLIYFVPGAAPVRTMNLRLKNYTSSFEKNELNMGEFKIDGSIGYLRFKSFAASHGIKYNEFLKRSFSKIKKQKIDKLIIDLRGNTGGAMQYQLIGYFVGNDVEIGKYIIQKPKQIFENVHLKKWNAEYYKHKRTSKIQRRLVRHKKFNEGNIKTKGIYDDLIYHGEVVVITDEGTFSSAAILACHLKTIVGAKLIGSTAGGSFYAGNAGTLILELPHSKLHMFVNPNTFYSHLDYTKYDANIKYPDIVVDTVIQDKRLRDNYYFKAAKNAFD